MRNHGFTLIELSIVLVIIGLIVGGILVGQDLIKAGENRAQISQIEKYNQAVNTFRAKFNGLPGDLSLSSANQFGFASDATCNGTTTGSRDGNGLLELCGGASLGQGCGDVSYFWQDLSSAAGGNLINGSFPNSGALPLTCTGPLPVTYTTTKGTTYIGDLLPDGKIGHGTFVYVYDYSGYNWYGLSSVTQINTIGVPTSGTPIPVIQAYNIDKKMDDGIPGTGTVQAVYVNFGVWTLPTVTPTDTTTSCASGTTVSNAVYSIGSLANYGNNGNCVLSFRFQ